MSKAKTKPRRERVPGDANRNIYKRADGTLEIGARDANGTLRWVTVNGGITAARKERNALLAARDSGHPIQSDTKLRFGPVADECLAGPIAALGKKTRAAHTNNINKHLKPRWGRRQLNAIEPDDVAQLVRDLRAAGYAEWTIAQILGTVSKVFGFAKRRKKWKGISPTKLLERGEGARVSQTPEPRIYRGDELAQVLAATTEPWRTLFRLAGVGAGRESEVLGLWWENFDLEDVGAATVSYEYQVDRDGIRSDLKTEESQARLPLPRSLAIVLRAHRASSKYTGPKDFVFTTSTGRPLHQRNVLRALYKAQENARTPEGVPTFSELFERDEEGELVTNDRGQYVPNNKRRRDLPPLPDFHALRHTAAMDCDDVEEARDLLRHKDSVVTARIYRKHFSDQRREALRAKMEARDARARTGMTGN
jgi:integrase